MKAKLISIGNSKGIRIPKTLLRQCNIENQVELEVKKEGIFIKPVKTTPREGWDRAFKSMHEQDDDALLVDETIEMEMDDWEWK